MIKWRKRETWSLTLWSLFHSGSRQKPDNWNNSKWWWVPLRSEERAFRPKQRKGYRESLTLSGQVTMKPDSRGKAGDSGGRWSGRGYSIEQCCRDMQTWEGQAMCSTGRTGSQWRILSREEMNHAWYMNISIFLSVWNSVVLMVPSKYLWPK